jgi:hypothetical protein
MLPIPILLTVFKLSTCALKAFEFLCRRITGETTWASPSAECPRRSHQSSEAATSRLKCAVEKVNSAISRGPRWTFITIKTVIAELADQSGCSIAMNIKREGIIDILACATLCVWTKRLVTHLFFFVFLFVPQSKKRGRLYVLGCWSCLFWVFF